MTDPLRKPIMLLASGGGHWTQLMRLRSAFQGHRLVFVGVKDFYREDVDGECFEVIEDVSRLHRWNLPLTLLKLAYLLLRYRPAMLVTTGSMPGMLALRLAKFLVGSTTVWIDSVANVEEMSLSGRKARRHADLWLTQWEHLAQPDGPIYLGSVI
jgi:UDP-N-acetylglucosamine:LPS N-acetylglucosamine transferase